MKLKTVQIDYTVNVGDKAYQSTIVRTIDVVRPQQELETRTLGEALTVFKQFDSITIQSAWYRSSTGEIIQIPVDHTPKV